MQEVQICLTCFSLTYFSLSGWTLAATYFLRLSSDSRVCFTNSSFPSISDFSKIAERFLQNTHNLDLDRCNIISSNSRVCSTLWICLRFQKIFKIRSVQILSQSLFALVILANVFPEYLHLPSFASLFLHLICQNCLCKCHKILKLLHLSAFLKGTTFDKFDIFAPDICRFCASKILWNFHLMHSLVNSTSLVNMQIFDACM